MCRQHEISILNQPEYKANSNWLQQLQQLIESEQNELRRPENREVMERWETERDQLRSVRLNCAGGGVRSGQPGRARPAQISAGRPSATSSGQCG